MLGLLQVLTVMIVVLPTALSVAHALELPGKLRLDEDTYRAVQRIYYPGFTIGGIAEAPAILVTAVLLLLTPAGTAAFWLVLIALVGMVAMHGIYWVAIHPVNKHWMEGQPVSSTGASFFGTKARQEGGKPAWTQLRDRWEYAHVARAVLTSISLLALVVSLALRP